MQKFNIAKRKRDGTLAPLSKEDQVRAEKSAMSTAKYLWNFLTGMAVKHNISMQVAA